MRSQNAAAICYYLRLLVKNVGNQRAEMVEVFAAELREKLADDSFTTAKRFLPMNLRWSHTGKIFLDGLAPAMEKYCDLGHIIDPAQRHRFLMEDDPALGLSSEQTVLSLDLEMKPFTMSHLVAPGTYHLFIKVAAANVKPVPKTFEIVLTGRWHEDERRMLGDGIAIRMPE
jgi:hypothetical protein